jgi:hypothetical protein
MGEQGNGQIVPEAAALVGNWELGSFRSVFGNGSVDWWMRTVVAF